MTAAEMREAADARLQRRDLGGVVALLDTAERGGVDADLCAGQRWMAHMLGADFEAAWCESDTLRWREAPDRHRFWRGEDIRGQRLMLRSLHGFGDAVQMFRFIPRLRESVAELVVEVPPRFVETVECFAGMSGVRVITWGPDAPTKEPEWDVQAEVMELPYMLRIQCGELPGAVKYLTPPPLAVERVKNVLEANDSKRVGVVWSAGQWNPSRCVSIAELGPLLEVDGCEFWNLQGSHSAAEWKDFNWGKSQATKAERPARRDAADCGDGILTLAAVISQLDLVITVDTLAAHLAGAMGVPTWVMLQHAADWRWMIDRRDSPWYPSLRLFRQRATGGWKPVIDEMVQELGRTICQLGRGGLVP